MSANAGQLLCRCREPRNPPEHEQSHGPVKATHLEKTAAYSLGDRVQIQESQKIDGFELAVNGSANPARAVGSSRLGCQIARRACDNHAGKSSAQNQQTAGVRQANGGRA